MIITVTVLGRFGSLLLCSLLLTRSPFKACLLLLTVSSSPTNVSHLSPLSLFLPDVCAALEDVSAHAGMCVCWGGGGGEGGVIPFLSMERVILLWCDSRSKHSA